MTPFEIEPISKSALRGAPALATVVPLGETVATAITGCRSPASSRSRAASFPSPYEVVGRLSSMCQP